MDTLEVCPTFANFSFEQTNTSNIDIGLTTHEDPEQDMLDEDDGGFDPGFEPMDVDFETTDSNTNNQFNIFNNANIEVGGEEGDAGFPEGVDTVTVSNDAWAEFQYFNPKLATNWAGPDHWRFTSKTKATTSKDAENGEVEEGKKKGKKKGEPFFIDFFGPPPPASLFASPKNVRFFLFHYLS